MGRGIGFGLVGFFLLRSAMTYDPNEATGLDGALRRLAVNSWGVFVVAIVGIGFVAYWDLLPGDVHTSAASGSVMRQARCL